MTDKPSTARTSRRSVVGGMAGGVLAAIANPAQAQQSNAAPIAGPAKQDPTT